MIDNAVTLPDSGDSVILKSHEYTLENRVFIVNPVYREKGENTKEILTKLMCDESKKH